MSKIKIDKSTVSSKEGNIHIGHQNISGRNISNNGAVFILLIIAGIVALILIFIFLGRALINDKTTRSNPINQRTEGNNYISVEIKGVDDGIKTTRQNDYKEALLFAKRQAIERGGVQLKSMTTVKDMVINEDYIESKSVGVLQPGYEVIDIGYINDGTYQVVLVGKIRLLE